MAPNWVPRSFCVPGRRVSKPHPDDYCALRGRGGIDERWLSSTIRADNGPLTGADEGLSFVVGPDGERLPFDEVVADLGASLVGEGLWRDYGGWPMYAKPLRTTEGLLLLPRPPFRRDGAWSGVRASPRPHYFPPQMNNHLGTTPWSFFGLIPGTTKEEFKGRLAGFGTKGDNRVTDLSVAYRIQLGTGWDMPTGCLHAPASVCTYEPQWGSDSPRHVRMLDELPHDPRRPALEGRPSRAARRP